MARRSDEGRLFRFEISGTGFLRHMVRTIVGTLVDIGRGKMEVDEMRAIIDSKDRSRAGQTAPAAGADALEGQLLGESEVPSVPGVPEG